MGSGMSAPEFIVLARGSSPKEAFTNMKHRMRGHETYVIAHHFELTKEEARVRIIRMLRDSDSWKQTLQDAVGCVPLTKGAHSKSDTVKRFLFFGFGPPSE